MKISIIIATYNSESDIEKSILSVLSQSFQNWELLIIDGQSTDRTLEIIESISSNDKRVVVQSEEDEGIYDAWNKGVSLSNGEWIIFFGADDTLSSEYSLEEMVPYLNSKKSKIFYSNLMVLDKKGVPFSRIGSEWKDPWNGLDKRIWCDFPIPIMASFFHKSVFDEVGGFDTKYRILADIDLVLKIAKKYKPKYIDGIDIVNMGYGGISTTPKFSLLLMREAFEVRSSRGLSLLNIGFCFLCVKQIIKKLIYILFPASLVDMIFNSIHTFKKKRGDR